MQTAAKSTLAALVEDHLTSLVRESICVQRHAKRARYHQVDPSTDEGIIRRRLHAEDINLALQWRGSEKLYATGTVVPNAKDSKKKIDLNAYLKTEMTDKPPAEIGMTMHWLAVDGKQPNIPQNPSQLDSVVHRVQDDDHPHARPSGTDPSSHAMHSVAVRTLIPRLLSEELQLYFTRVTLAIQKGGGTKQDRQHQDAALARISQDNGLQELIPFFLQYLCKQLHIHLGHPDHSRVLIRLARSMLINPHVHLELHLHQLLPALITNVVAKKLATNSAQNHWALRHEAAQTLKQACDLFGQKYPSLKASVLKTLHEAITPDRPFTTMYGGLTGLSLFGAKAVDAFVMPSLIPLWTRLESQLTKATATDSLLQRCEILECQQALLNCLGVFYQGSSIADQADRISAEDMEDALGDQLVPLRNTPPDYIECWI